MGFLDMLRGGGQPADRNITVNRDLRRGQLMQLEGALLDLMDAIKAHPGYASPGWQARHAEYLQVVQTVQQVRASEFDWATVSDIGFDLRPMVKGEPTPDQAAIVAAQERVMALGRAITTPHPDEIG